MAYDMEATGHDCYSGTTCLVNLLDIHDENILAATEAALTLGKTSELLHKPLSGPFDFACYKVSISIFSVTCTLGPGRCVISI